MQVFHNPGLDSIIDNWEISLIFFVAIILIFFISRNKDKKQNNYIFNQEKLCNAQLVLRQTKKVTKKYAKVDLSDLKKDLGA